MKKLKNNKRVLVAMSGGVDSAVAAQLLKNQGYEVVGVFLHFWAAPPEAGRAEPTNKCCSLKAQNDAKAVCQKIGISFFTLNYSAPFKKEVVDYFLQEYSAGRTPNPCVKCNKKIKIGGLLKYARGLKFDYLATGHYLKNKLVDKQFKLYKAKDKNKDQSYFLYTFNQAELKYLLFPLGNYTKPEVRALARKFDLPVAEKAESQEICFIPGKHHNDFLKKYLKLKAGRIMFEGQEIAKHQGLALYTIGQRRGIEIGGNGPYYVAGFNRKNNDLIVVKEFDDDSLFGDELKAKQVSWLGDKAPSKAFKCSAVIRYRHPAQTCLVKPDGANNSGKYSVKFTHPQRAITKGQSIVFYKGQEVLGGGIIE